MPCFEREALHDVRFPVDNPVLQRAIDRGERQGRERQIPDAPRQVRPLPDLGASMVEQVRIALQLGLVLVYQEPEQRPCGGVLPALLPGCLCPLEQLDDRDETVDGDLRARRWSADLDGRELGSSPAVSKYVAIPSANQRG